MFICTNKFVTAVAVAAFIVSMCGCSSVSDDLSLAGIDTARVDPGEVKQAGEKAEADAKAARMAREAAEQARIAADAARDDADRLRMAAEKAEGTASPAAVRLAYVADAAEEDASAAEVEAEEAGQVLKRAEEALVSALAALLDALAGSTYDQETLDALASAQKTLAAYRMAERIAEEREREIRNAQRLAGSEGGLAASPATPVYAASDEDTLASLLPGGEVIFAPLSAALLLDTIGKNRGVTEPDLGAAYVKSVSGDGAGGFRVTYVIDGIETPVHFEANRYYGGVWSFFYDDETTEDDQHRLWSHTDSFEEDPNDRTRTDRTDGSSEFTYFDINGWNDDRGGARFQGYSTYGMRTRPEYLPLGSATYEGRMQAEIRDSNDPYWNNQTLIRGALTLEADLDEREISGRIDEIHTRLALSYVDEYEPLAVGSSIDISSAAIGEGRFTAHWVGSDLDEEAADGDTLGGFEGTMLGEFYGPAAEEVGGVLSGRRDATGATPEQYLIGGFGAGRFRRGERH